MQNASRRPAIGALLIAFIFIIISGIALSSAILMSPAELHAEVPLVVYDPRPLGSPLELHVTNDGKVSAQGVHIEQIAGGTFYAKLYWGTTYLRMTLRTDANTKATKRYGQPIKVSDIKPGDFVSVEGEFYGGTGSFDVTTKTIKDWSIQTDEREFKGTISEVFNDAKFSLKASDGSTLTMLIGTSTVVTRGNVSASTSALVKGARISQAFGTYDARTNVLDAKIIRLYQDMSVFQPRNFEGVYRSTTSTSLPATLTVSINQVEYKVVVPSSTPVLNAKRQIISLNRFAPGDTIRFYGKLREETPDTIDCEIVRNLSF